MYLGHVKVLLGMFLSLKTLYRKRTVIWPFYFYTIIRTLSIIYSDFSHYLLLIILFSLVILQYILVVGTISMVSPNILISLGISIVYWIGSVILVAINKNIFGIVAPFEASNTMYRAVEKILNNESTFMCPTEIINIVSFFVLLFIVNTIVLLLSRKRWLKIGM
ncbi:putative peptide export permease protein [Staphylococcus aureus]|nr:putative peptide export permease protein [Staphylococcus aureus]CAC7835061.1 putative peptide export permease protein [Staphylococcus aureus]CAC7887273.1 putative peptide export permease protein [Staphylococcus aureus]CAC7925000.1 putative peptide export permease protein [Staphylococcus aureus]